MLTSLKHWLAPPVFEGDERKTRTAGILNAILLTTLLIAGVFLLLTIFNPAGRPRLLNIFAPMFLGVIGLLVLQHRGQVYWAGGLTVLMIGGAIAYATFTNGGVRAPSFGAFILLALCAGLLMGQRTGFWVAIAASGYGLVLVYADHLGRLPAPLGQNTALVVWLTQTVYAFMAAVLLAWATHSIQHALQQAHQELIERQHTETALREAEAAQHQYFAEITEALNREQRLYVGLRCG